MKETTTTAAASGSGDGELIARGILARTRAQARQELEGRDNGDDHRRTPDMSAAASIDAAFALSPRYIDPATYVALRRRPSPRAHLAVGPMSTRVREGHNRVDDGDNDDGNNDDDDEDDRKDSGNQQSRERTPRRRQSWFSPVHVPLAHRKLVESPRVLGGLMLSRPLKPPPPKPKGAPPSSSPSASATVAVSDGGRRRLTPPDRAFLARLRERNQVLYDKLVTRFRSLRNNDDDNDDDDGDGGDGGDDGDDGERRNDEKADEPRGADRPTPASVSHQGPIDDGPRHRRRPRLLPARSRPRPLQSPPQPPALADITHVEDAVLYFMHEKHAHDLLYFRRRSDAATSSTGARLSLANTTDAASARYMPYDLERVPELPASGGGGGGGDFFIMSSTVLVHHTAAGNNDGAPGEAIPIAQWVMESKMFSLLLAGIPLFQKFLLRKVFVSWAVETRRLIFVDLRRRLHRSLPLARGAFVRPLLQSREALRRLERLRALTLPPRHLSAVTLAAVQEHHRELLTETETKLIDVKEELLGLLDAMVQGVRQDRDPSTDLDTLYQLEAHAIHMSNPKWKSAPLHALRRRKESLSRQMETASVDLGLLEPYVRLMEYMFAEGVYHLVIHCIRRMTRELRADDNAGGISASVTIVGEDLVLSPSFQDMKGILLESITRLIRLAANFHFTKNAMAWSTNRGTGSLSVIASTLSSDAIASQFDLQDVLRHDKDFDSASNELIDEVAKCFDEAARQMKVFESLKLIYAAVQSVSRAETLKNLRNKGGVSATADVVELSSVTGIQGTELARYLKMVAHRLTVLDRSQHSCQKIQSSWKVGFLEIQCRKSVTEFLERINEERDGLHRQLLALAVKGVGHCLAMLQSASLVFEDRPQLIESFCEQMKQVKALKGHEKQLHQDVRNVDEVVRALRRYAPAMMGDSAIQYNLLHSMLSKYDMLSQSHDKFVTKMLPHITQQVSNALQRYAIRCQRLLRIYDENLGISTDEELERNLGTFQDIAREIRSIEDATHLYQDYQKMVGMKVMEISMLGEVKCKWDEVHAVVSFAVEWNATLKAMESGVFTEQPWRYHLETVQAFVPRVQALQGKPISFASKLIEKFHGRILDYQRHLEVVIEMAQPFVKPYHWQQILSILDIVNYVSASGVVLADGSTLTLGLLLNRNLWKFEGYVREITMKARHDALTESKIDEMKRRMYAAILPLIKVEESYEIDSTGALRLLSQFEHDLLTVQTLAQLTSFAHLSSTLSQWAEEISSYQELLDMWVNVQSDWRRLTQVFTHHDVQQSVVDATYEFQALDRKWRAMMSAAKGASSLAVCLREVMSRAFLNNCSAISDKLWRELGTYLWEKRSFFPRFHFVSDKDLLHIIASTKYPDQLCRLISKCFREVCSLRIARIDANTRKRQDRTVIAPAPINEEDDKKIETTSVVLNVVQHFDIDGVVGRIPSEQLSIKPLRVTSSPEIWMKDLCVRIRDSVRDVICLTLDGPLVVQYENNFGDLNKRDHSTDSNEDGVQKRPDHSHWHSLPLQLVLLCVNILLTSELTPLVNADRSGPEWSSFMGGFKIKKGNLVEFIRRYDVCEQDRWIASNLMVFLLNKETAVHDLFDEDPAVLIPPAPRHHHDTTSIHYNYANGSSFAWTKMMRFYYEPFDKKCVIHHTVKSFEYGNSFLSGHDVPVLTPLCDRAVLALNLALSLEVGALMHSRGTGKRSLVREVSTAVGCECVEFDCSIALGFSQFHRLVLGALLADFCWVCLSGLESRCDLSAIKMVAQDIGRLRDAIHCGGEAFMWDGVSVPITNPRVAIVFTCSLDVGNNARHREIILRLSQALMPVACAVPDLRVIAEAFMTANGVYDASILSLRLILFLQTIESSPTPYLSASLSFRQLMRLMRSAISRHRSNPLMPNERCLVLSLWEELGSNILPEQRLAVLKQIRAVFPSSIELHLSPIGILATRVGSMDAGTSQLLGDALAYESEEEDKRHKLIGIRENARIVLEQEKHLIATDQILRKLVDMYQVVCRNMITVVVGTSGCGKTSTLDVLGAVFASQNRAISTDGDQLESTSSIRIRLHRLFPNAIRFADIYGQFNEDNTWSDGYITRYMKAHAHEVVTVPRVPASRGEETPGADASTPNQETLYSSSDAVRGPNSSWLVLDGIGDPSLIEPLKDLGSSEPSATRMFTLPNGDQLQIENTLMRVLCEVQDLRDWSPVVTSRCGVVHLASDSVTYTIMIKSWLNRLIHNKPRYSNVLAVMAKVTRTILPALLEVCKKHSKAFLEILVPHLVNNLLMVLESRVEYMRPGSTGDDRDATVARIVVAHSAMLSLGLLLPMKGRNEFHRAVVGAVPEILDECDGGYLKDPSKTIFDVSLRIQHEQIVLVPFEQQLQADAVMPLGSPASTRKFLARKQSDMTISQSQMGLGFTSSIFIPTAGQLGYREWLRSLLMARLNVFVFGDSGCGKTRLVDDVLSELISTDVIDGRALQVGPATTSDDIAGAVESSLPRKMRGLYCPRAGKRSLVVVIENLNLESEVRQSSDLMVRPCSEYLRQVCDAKGSFVKQTKEFVEFRDVLIASTFSLSPFGYPRMTARFLRHFLVLWVADPSRDVFNWILTRVPDQFIAKWSSMPLSLPEVRRLCQLPIETFNAMRKHLKPTTLAPHLLIGINDVVRCLARFINVSVKAVEDLSNLELYSVYCTYQVFRCRVVTPAEQGKLRGLCMDTATKLGFSSSSTAAIRHPEEHIYADHGDNEGCVRLTRKSALGFFTMADEKYQWYNRSTPKDLSTNKESPPQPDATAEASSPVKTPSKALTKRVSAQLSSVPLEPTRAVTTPPDPASQPQAPSETLSGGNQSRRESLIMVSGKPTLLEKSTAASPATIQNMLDVHALLMSGEHLLLLCGAEPSKRRSATMIACGAQAFHFREVTSHLKFADFVDQLKGPIMDAGLKSAHTMMFVDCDSLTSDEFKVLTHVMLHNDLPHHLYTSSDKAKVLAQEHQLRSYQPVHMRRPSTSSFFDDLNTTPASREGASTLSETQQRDWFSPPSTRKRSTFHDNLKKCLYIALSFGLTTRLFDLVLTQPTLFYQSAMKTFHLFDRESLEAVYNECLGSLTSLNDALARTTISSSVRHDLLGLTIAIHFDAVKTVLEPIGDESPEQVGRRYSAARSRYEDFLNVFKGIYSFQRLKLSETIQLHSRMLALLEHDAAAASDQLSKSADGQVLLEEASRAVVASSTRLKEYEVVEREARRSFLLDEQRCSILQSQIEQERDLIQKELQKTLPEVTKAIDALSQINKLHITEMKSFINPPQLVRLAMQAVCVLLGAPPTWTEALRILADIHFLDRLRKFEKDRVDAALIDRVKLYTNHPDFSMENMKRASLASSTLCKWVLAIVRYFEVMRRIAPTQKKLNETELQFNQIDDMVRKERQKLVDLELQLNDLRAEHARNLQREQEWQRSHESKVRWKAEVLHYQEVINRWIIIVRKRLESRKKRQFTLIGDSAIVAATMVYGCGVPGDQRLGAIQRWRQLALEHLRGHPNRTSGPAPSVSMPDAYAFMKLWFVDSGLLTASLRKAVIGVTLARENALTLSMVLMDQVRRPGASKYPLLVDPLGTATTWLKKRLTDVSQAVAASQAGSAERPRGAQSPDDDGDVDGGAPQAPPPTALIDSIQLGILIVDVGDPNAVMAIEKRISHKPPLLIVITEASECDEGAFHALLDVVDLAKKKGNHTIVFTTPALNEMVHWKPKVWSQLTVIDCTPTSDDMGRFLQSALLLHHWPSLERAHERASEDFVVQSTRQEEIVQSFLDDLARFEDERRTPARRSAFLGDGAEPTLHAEDMGRISRYLGDYDRVATRRARAKASARELDAKKGQYVEPLTRQASAFLLAEELLFQYDGATASGVLAWTPTEVAHKILECMAGHLPTLPWPATEALEVAHAHAPMDLLLGDFTSAYVAKRLRGLPSRLHRPFRFLAAIGLATARGELQGLARDRLVTSVVLSRIYARPRKPRRPGPTTSKRANPQPPVVEGDVDEDAIRRELAESVVASCVFAALQRVEHVAPTDAALNGEDLETSLPETLRPAFKSLAARITGCVVDPTRARALLRGLHRDLTRHADDWTEFLRAPGLGAPITSRPRRLPTLTITTTLGAMGNELLSTEDNDDLSGPSDLGAGPDTNDGDGGGSGSPLPTWVVGLGIMERLLLVLVPLGAVAVEHLDAVATHYLDGCASTARISDDDAIPTTTTSRPSLDRSNNTNSNLSSSTSSLGSLGSLEAVELAQDPTRPLWLHHDPAQDVLSPAMRILACARARGIREDAITVSAAHNAFVDSDSGDAPLSTAMALPPRLRGLKDTAVGGGWLVLDGADRLRPVMRNLVRLQLQGIADPAVAHKISSDFRLWLVSSLPGPGSPDASHPHGRRRQRPGLQRWGSMHDHLRAQATRCYLESPQSLLDHYSASLADETQRRQQWEQQQQQQHQQQSQSQSQQSKPLLQQLPPPSSSSRRVGGAQVPRRWSSHALSQSATPPTAEQRWLQIGLWFAHCLARRHHALTHWRGTELTGLPPTDTVISPHELERAFRAVQLHQRQRVVAAAMSTASGAALSAALGPSPAHEWVSHVALARGVYGGRTGDPTLGEQFEALLGIALSPSSSARDGTAGGGWRKWLGASEWAMALLNMRDALTERTGASACVSSSSPSSLSSLPSSASSARRIATPALENAELALLPPGLAALIRGAECGDVLSRLVDERYAHALPSSASPRSQVDPDDGALTAARAAQRTAQQLLPQLPSPAALTEGVQRQEHLRRTSVLVVNSGGARRTPRATAAATTKAATVMSGGGGTTDTPHAKSDMDAATMTLDPQGQCDRALWEHLVSVELPAMATYARYVGETLETIASLPVEHLSTTTAVYRDLAVFVEALHRRQLPRAWRTGPVGTGQQQQQHVDRHYACPRRLNKWIKWLQRAVAFYQEQLRVATPTTTPVVLWAPALRFPHACLFQLRVAMARALGHGVDDLALVVGNGTAGEEPRDRLASFVLMGLHVWNARWSPETAALELQAPPPTQSPARASGGLAPPSAEALPALTVSVALRHRPRHRASGVSGHVTENIGSSSMSAGHQEVSSAYLYRCPVYPELASRLRLEPPIAHVLVPTDERSEVMAANGVMLVLQPEPVDWADGL